MRDDLVWHFLNVALALRICKLAADQTLGGKESILRVNNSPPLRGNTNKTFTILSKSDY